MKPHLVCIRIVIFISSLPTLTISECPITQCSSSDSSPIIRFPFQQQDPDQPHKKCGFPGFDLYCDSIQQQTLIHLQSAGTFSVPSIDYVKQEITLTDPNNCLPKKLLAFNHTGSPFRHGKTSQKFEVYNCSGSSYNYSFYDGNFLTVDNCLSGANYTVVGLMEDQIGFQILTQCHRIKAVKIPGKFSGGYPARVLINWDKPDCKQCEANGGMCEPRADGALQVQCSHRDPAKTIVIKFAIGCGVGVPLLVLIDLLLRRYVTRRDNSLTTYCCGATVYEDSDDEDHGPVCEPVQVSTISHLSTFQVPDNLQERTDAMSHSNSDRSRDLNRSLTTAVESTEERLSEAAINWYESEANLIRSSTTRVESIGEIRIEDGRNSYEWPVNLNGSSTMAVVSIGERLSDAAINWYESEANLSRSSTTTVESIGEIRIEDGRNSHEWPVNLNGPSTTAVVSTGERLNDASINWYESEANLSRSSTTTVESIGEIRIEDGRNSHEWPVNLNRSSTTAVVSTGRGLSDAAINSYESVPIGEKLNGEDTKCIICLENYEAGELVKHLPCMHRFHAHCVDQALRVDGRCPNCRFDLHKYEQI